jgi:NAD-dependent deacetylase
MPPRCECGGVLKPNTVLFGESLPPDALETAWREAGACRVMLVVGTSALVQPAASLPLLAREHGARVVEINPAPTPLSAVVDEVIREPAAIGVPKWFRG